MLNSALLVRTAQALINESQVEAGKLGFLGRADCWMRCLHAFRKGTKPHTVISCGSLSKARQIELSGQCPEPSLPDSQRESHPIERRLIMKTKKDCAGLAGSPSESSRSSAQEIEAASRLDGCLDF